MLELRYRKKNWKNQQRTQVAYSTIIPTCILENKNCRSIFVEYNGNKKHKLLFSNIIFLFYSKLWFLKFNWVKMSFCGISDDDDGGWGEEENGAQMTLKHHHHHAQGGVDSHWSSWPTCQWDQNPICSLSDIGPLWSHGQHPFFLFCPQLSWCPVVSHCSTPLSCATTFVRLYVTLHFRREVCVGSFSLSRNSLSFCLRS